jgi:putative DNA primase/helicase
MPKSAQGSVTKQSTSVATRLRSLEQISRLRDDANAIASSEQIKRCSLLDHSDVDNAKRLIEHFGHDLLVRQESGVAGGAAVHWNRTHWDIDQGSAGWALTAHKVGDLIKLECDFIQPTDDEAAAIDAGLAADQEIREIRARSKETESEAAKSVQTKLRLKELRAAVLRGRSVENAVETRRRSRLRHATATKNRSKMDAMMACAKPYLRVSPNDFNPDPLKVATLSHTLRFRQIVDHESNGLVSWACEAEPTHRRSDMITAIVPIKYDATAQCPRWRAALERFQPNAEQRRTLQQFTGAGLLGKPIQRVMVHFGDGANFKSMFLETVTRVLGDYLAVGLPTESLMYGAKSSAGGPRPDLERLFGKRMLRVLELPLGVKIKTDLIKKLTGGERWPVRTLYKGYYEFEPVAKAHLSANAYPTFDGSDGGMRRRLIIMHWPVTIPEKYQRDFDVVLAEFLQEREGILNWLIEGALDYLQNGLVISDYTRTITNDCIDEMDPVARFVRDCIVSANGQAIPALALFNAYVAHCTANAREVISMSKFGRSMRSRFKRIDTSACRLYTDICLRDLPV